MKRSTARLIQLVVFIADVALVVAISRAERPTEGMFTLLYAAIAVSAGVVIYCRYRMRCPKCGRWPTRGYLAHSHCPYCGEPLDKERE